MMEEEEEQEQEQMMSLRARRKRSSVGIVCCFTGHNRRASLDASSNYLSPLRSPSTWFKSCRGTDSPEGKCRNFISRMARHRRHSSADFSYDPLSYALNFEDEASPLDHDQCRALSFNARLQSTPSPRIMKTALHDPPHLPRSTRRLISTEEGRNQNRSGSDDLRRGFEALSVSMMQKI